MVRWWEQAGRLQWNEGRALEHNCWYTPIGNIIPPVRSEMAGMPDRVLVKDDTLSEGEEQPNHIPFTVDMKLKLAHELEDAGITETEVAFPATLESHYKVCRAIQEAGIKMQISTHPSPTAPNWKEQLRKTADAGGNVAYLLFPATDSSILRLRNSGIKISKEHMVEDLCQHITSVVEYAKSVGLIVRAGIYSVAKAPLERVPLIYKAMRGSWC